MKFLLSEAFTLRKPSELPFYCRPVALFISVWLIMLLALQTQFSYSSYPEILMAWMLFVSSLASLLLGYYAVRLVSLVIHPPKVSLRYRIDLNRLRRVQWWFLAVAGSVIFLNLISYGLPPIFGFFGAATLSYVEYGKLKQVLNAVTMAIFVTAGLDSSRFRKLIMFSFPILCMLSYVTRGFLMIMLFQGLFVFSLRTQTSKRKLYLIAATAIIVAAIAANVIGNGRNQGGTSELFAAFFNIKPSYADRPMILLWIISYISVPLSNLCWIIYAYHYTHPTAAFLTTLLPSFWAPPSLEAGNLGSNNIIDGVHTYLAKYYIDLWFFGIFAINFVWGLISGYLSVGNRISVKYLTSAVFLSAISFIFFADYLTMLSIVMEIFLLAFVQRYVTLPLSQAA
jgi:oligosaccharide repeat unit polymerase